MNMQNDNMSYFSLSEMWTSSLSLAAEQGYDLRTFVSGSISSIRKCYNNLPQNFEEEKDFYIIPHFPPGSDLNSRRWESESISQRWKERMIKRISDEEPSKKHDLMSIYGEFSDVDTIKYALDSGFHTTVICGNTLINNDYKDNILNLINDKRENIDIYIYKERPKQHSILINNQHLLIEEEHEIGEFYEYAYIFENISEEVKRQFTSRFKKLQSNSRIADTELIKNMKVFEGSLC